MGIFSKSTEMARETPQPESSAPSIAPEPARPGTSGTEMLLTNNRRRASHRYKDAQKKEREYKTKKRSASARANYTAAVSATSPWGSHIASSMSRHALARLLRKR